MVTREKAIEACRAEAKEASYRPFFAPCDPKLDAQRTERMLRFGGAATLLNRDGRLRERLEGLVAELRERCTTETEMKLHGWESLIDVLKDCADDLEAALKEGEK